MTMPKFLFIVLLSLIMALPAHAESVPAPADKDTRYYLSIPEGGLKAFLTRPAFPVPMVSHHRGGPAPGFPENSIEAMDNALRYGFGIMEIDVAQLADGTLILMHDDTLGRTTTGTGALRQKNWADVSELFLKDNDGLVTNYRIPKLETVLRWTKGKAILTLDIKRGTDFKKVAELVASTGSKDYVAAISYSIKQAKAFHALAPDMPLSISFNDATDIKNFDESGIANDVVIAWTGTSLKAPAHYKALHARGWRVMAGTLGRPDRSIDGAIARGETDLTYRSIIELGVDVIATDRFWAAQADIANPNILVFTHRRAQGQP